jgi:predicted nuclease with TOPRIM domain
MVNEIMKRIREADKEYADAAALNATQKKLADELIEIQKHINDVKARLEAFKEKKAEIDPIILEAIKKLKADGILLEKALIYLSKGVTVPSFKAVYEMVMGELKPAAKTLLEEAYKKLTVEREPSVVVKIKNESIMGTVLAWIKTKLNPLVDSVSSGIQKVASLLGVPA